MNPIIVWVLLVHRMWQGQQTDSVSELLTLGTMLPNLKAQNEIEN